MTPFVSGGLDRPKHLPKYGKHPIHDIHSQGWFASLKFRNEARPYSGQLTQLSLRQSIGRSSCFDKFGNR
jgi:hypothetical protein